MHARELIGAFSGLTCPAAVAILVCVCVRSDQRGVRRLAYGGAIATTPLAIASLLASGATWSRACAVVTLLAIAQAAAIVFAIPRPLADYLEDDGAFGDPPWWPAFERRLRAYSRRAR